jgi:cytochrome c oxidase accessory protein FixG
VLGWTLIAIFLGLPHNHISGKTRLFLDLANRQFTVFGVTLHPTENLILLAFGAFVIIGVFAVTSMFGRLWCGYACPQPVYLEFVFRPIERWLEGSPTKRRKRDNGPWTFDRAWRKGSKWVIYALVALLMSATFVSYFVGWGPLWQQLLSAPLDNTGVLFATGFTTALVFFDFAYFRDQMCTVACPYGRLQTVLYDSDTIIVGYDTTRGEPRARKRDRKGGGEFGDCVDCGRCVTTCPTGMDIRRGLQMECIGCAQCIEACDEVMDKTGKPQGLIRYTSLRELETGTKSFLRARVYIYVALMTVALTALIALSVGRSDAGVEILRGGREPFRMLPTGEVANIIRVRLTNNLHQPQAFTVTLSQPAGAQLVVSQSPFTVAGDKVATLDVVAKLPEDVFVRGQTQGMFIIKSDAGVTLEKEFVLLGPYR